MSNLLNTSTWTVGTGSVTGFTMNGNAAENSRQILTDPWNKESVIWVGQCDGVLTGTIPYETAGEGESNNDGGWNSTNIAIDPNYMYRFSCWVNHKVWTGGGTSARSYFGTNGYAANGSTNVGVKLITTGTNQTNAYFESDYLYTFPENQWILCVGHVWPHTTNYATVSTHSDSGYWNLDGSRNRFINYDFIWNNTCAYTRHRMYMFYCIVTGDSSPWTTSGDLSLVNRTWWVYPRIDKIDGTEPTVQQLIRNGTFAMNLNMGTNFLSLQCKDIQR